MILNQALPLLMLEVEKELCEHDSSPGLASPCRKGFLFIQHFSGISISVGYKLPLVQQALPTI